MFTWETHGNFQEQPSKFDILLVLEYRLWCSRLEKGMHFRNSTGGGSEIPRQTETDLEESAPFRFHSKFEICE